MSYLECSGVIAIVVVVAGLFSEIVKRRIGPRYINVTVVDLDRTERVVRINQGKDKEYEELIKSIEKELEYRRKNKKTSLANKSKEV